MESIEHNLPMAMTMAAFVGISWYIGVELNVSLFLFFKRPRGLYFWSCAIGSWGVITQALFIILADFNVWTNLKGSITFIYLSWLLMVVPQSWVLYSRLNLLMQHDSMLRWVRAVLIFTSLVFGITTIPLGILAQAVTPSIMPVNNVWDRLQTTVFFVQETALSSLYIFQTRKYLDSLSPLTERSSSQIFPDSSTTREKSRKTVGMLRLLIYINLLIIGLDVALLGIQYANLFYLQGAFKPAIYGVKLKLEFVILNRLIKSISRRDMSTLGSDIRRTPKSDTTGIINGSQGWNSQWPSPGIDEGQELRPTHVAQHHSSLEDMSPMQVF